MVMRVLVSCEWTGTLWRGSRRFLLQAQRNSLHGALPGLADPNQGGRLPAPPARARPHLASRPASHLTAAGKDTAKRVREARAARRLPKFHASGDSRAELLEDSLQPTSSGTGAAHGAAAGAAASQHAAPGEFRESQPIGLTAASLGLPMTAH
jgi:hypothetical protein